MLRHNREDEVIAIAAGVAGLQVVAADVYDGPVA
jgi:hypothetical protein